MKKIIVYNYRRINQSNKNRGWLKCFCVLNKMAEKIFLSGNRKLIKRGQYSKTFKYYDKEYIKIF